MVNGLRHVFVFPAFMEQPGHGVNVHQRVLLVDVTPREGPVSFGNMHFETCVAAGDPELSQQIEMVKDHVLSGVLGAQVRIKEILSKKTFLSGVCESVFGARQEGQKSSPVAARQVHRHVKVSTTDLLNEQEFPCKAGKQILRSDIFVADEDFMNEGDPFEHVLSAGPHHCRDMGLWKGIAQGPEHGHAEEHIPDLAQLYDKDLPDICGMENWDQLTSLPIATETL
jgi:hypothetical protein